MASEARKARRKDKQEAYKAEHGDPTIPSSAVSLPSQPASPSPASQLPEPPLQPAPAHPPTRHHDTALFLTVVFGLATVAAYLLQSNGVLTVPWIPSLIGYALMLAVFCWAFHNWDVPYRWLPWQRRSLLIS